MHAPYVTHTYMHNIIEAYHFHDINQHSLVFMCFREVLICLTT